MELFQDWNTPQKILVVLAHPDDPEFFLGATIARWVKAGHEVVYCLMTHGEKGSSDAFVPAAELAATREREQRLAGAALGVMDIRFLSYIDGELSPDVGTRREIVRVIRQVRPDVLVTCDPTNYFINDVYINHPDHRVAGQVVIDAVFPAAGNPRYFPELLEQDLPPYSVREVWMSLSAKPNIAIDVTEYWDIKIKALKEHCSQIPNLDVMVERQRSRRTPDSTPENPRYEDRFHRLLFR